MRLRFAIAFFALAMTDLAAARDWGPTGYWVTPNFSSVVRVDFCGEGQDLCGELVWLYEVSIDGKRMLDKRNPDESRRDRPLVGLSLFSRLPLDDGAWRGRIYNPGDGRRYRASIRQPDANRLRLRGCWGPFCKRQTWRRLSSVTLPTQESLERLP